MCHKPLDWKEILRHFIIKERIITLQRGRELTQEEFEQKIDQYILDHPHLMNDQGE